MWVRCHFILAVPKNGRSLNRQAIFSLVLAVIGIVVGCIIVLVVVIVVLCMCFIKPRCSRQKTDYERGITMENKVYA
jgi:heme/copper-type cytochrome/quinol oxidase subunit 2